MSTRGRIYEYFKIKQFEVMTVEIIPIEIPIYYKETCVVTSKWIDFIMWQEIHDLINQIIDEYSQNNINRTFKLKQGASVVIGYQFHNHEPSSGLFLTPRDTDDDVDDDDAHNVDFPLKDRPFLHYKECPMSLAISIYPTKLSCPEIQFPPYYKNNVSIIKKLLMNLMNQDAAMWLLNSTARKRSPGNNLCKSKECFSTSIESDNGSLFNSSILVKNKVDSKFAKKRETELKNGRPSKKTGSSYESGSSFEDIFKINSNSENLDNKNVANKKLQKISSHRRRNKSPVFSSGRKKFSYDAKNKSRKHDVKVNKDEEKKWEIKNFISDSCQNVADSQDFDDCTSTISNLSRRKQKKDKCKENIKSASKRPHVHKHYTDNMRIYQEILESSFNADQSLNPTPTSKRLYESDSESTIHCSVGLTDSLPDFMSDTDGYLGEDQALDKSNLKTCKRESGPDNTSSLHSFMSDSLANNQNSKRMSPTRRQSNISNYSNDSQLPIFMDDNELLSDNASCVQNSSDSLMNESDNLILSKSTNSSFNSSQCISSDKASDSLPDLTCSSNYSGDLFSIMNSQDILPDLSQNVFQQVKENNVNCKRKLSLQKKHEYRKNSKPLITARKISPENKNIKLRSGSKLQKNRKSNSKISEYVDSESPGAKTEKLKIKNANVVESNKETQTHEPDASKSTLLSQRTIRLSMESFKSDEDDNYFSTGVYEELFIEKVHKVLRSLTFHDFKLHFEKHLPHFQEMIMGKASNERDKKLLRGQNFERNIMSETFVNVLDEELCVKLCDLFSSQLEDLMKAANRQIPVLLYNLLVILPELIKRILLSLPLAKDRGIKTDDHCEEVFYQLTLYTGRNSP